MMACMTSKTPPESDPRLPKGWLALPVAIAAGAIGVTVATRRIMRRPVPKPAGRASVDGLHAPVEIIRDEWGVPHIYATHEADLFFAQGFVHAQDRLFQMDLNRRIGLGRLAEITGPLGVAFDRFARYLGWPRAAEVQVAGGDESTRAVVDAYAAGVNAFIATQPLPAEFKVLAYRPEPWDALATSAWGTVLAWGLSCNWETELLRAWLLDELGPERALAMTPVTGPDIPPLCLTSRLAGGWPRDCCALFRRLWPTGRSGRRCLDRGSAATTGLWPVRARLADGRTWQMTLICRQFSPPSGMLTTCPAATIM
jgi:acyl-homoserine lactone acylase PvdQ